MTKYYATENCRGPHSTGPLSAPLRPGPFYTCAPQFRLRRRPIDVLREWNVVYCVRSFDDDGVWGSNMAIAGQIVVRGVRVRQRVAVGYLRRRLFAAQPRCHYVTAQIFFFPRKSYKGAKRNNVVYNIIVISHCVVL